MNRQSIKNLKNIIKKFKDKNYDYVLCDIRDIAATDYDYDNIIISLLNQGCKTRFKKGDIIEFDYPNAQLK